MAAKVDISPSSVFVVSGGAKGITAECTIRLARGYSCKWILLGRSPIDETEPSWATDCVNEAELKKRIMKDFLARGEKPTPLKIQQLFKQLASSREIKATVAALEETGSQVEYISVDVTDASALVEKLMPAVERMGSIRGIIHGAGNLADKWIEKKTEGDFEKVYQAKVKGLENLLACIDPSQLDYLVLFSSVAGFFGNVGQSDYALANEILNKSAHLAKQHYPDCHVVAIDWGPWDSGMVTPELKKLYALRNIEVIPLDVGARRLIEELSRKNRETVQTVIGSLLTPPPEELDRELRTYRIRRQLTLAGNPFLADHVIGGNAVLPATCAVAWSIDACQQFYPGYTFSSLEDFKVLKGIVFDNSQGNEFVVDVREIAKTNGSEIVFEVRIWSEREKGKIRFHYSARVKLQAQTLESPIYEELKTTSTASISGRSLYENKTLFHGSTFQGIEQILQINSEGLLMQCRLPKLTDKQQGNFLTTHFNPYAADVLVQGILVWLELFYRVGCLPLEIARIDRFKHLPFDRRFYADIKIRSTTETNLIADITACDRDGGIYSSFSGVKCTVSDNLNQLFLVNRILQNTI